MALSSFTATTLSFRCSSSSPRSQRIPSNLNPSPRTHHTSSTYTKDLSHQQKQHKTLLVETFHRHNLLRTLLDDVSRTRSDPVALLRRDGDWTSDQLWAVVTLLVESGRPAEALQVFHHWVNIELARRTGSNYSRIIKLFCDEISMKEAISMFEEMQKHSLVPSFSIYNAIIHGFARKKDFDSSNASFRMMLDANVKPTTETYNGLMQAYGSFGLYDEMSKCMKRMKAEGCFPNEVTYNILISEFARGGLLEKMEGVYRITLSKHMNLLPGTIVSMLETYADFGIIDRMEKCYHRICNDEGFLTEKIIRKLATAYIKNYRFAQLEEFGNDVGSRFGRNDLVWRILLISSCCLMSKRGVESTLHEMEIAEVKSDTTYTNILAFFYCKMKDFRSLDAVFSKVGAKNIKPDIVTFGILFDACYIGYNAIHIIQDWRRNGFLEEVVELVTDPLVTTAFGKSAFLVSCEKNFSSLQPEARGNKCWRYKNLISLVFGKRS